MDSVPDSAEEFLFMPVVQYLVKEIDYDIAGLATRPENLIYVVP